MRFTIAALAVAVSAHNKTEFLKHIAKYNLSYGTKEEFEFRLTQFLKRDAEIAHFNATETSTHGHNKFSTWTPAEMKRLLGRHEGLNSFETGKVHVVDSNTEVSPIDWRDRNAVTPVKDQGQCGSCWTFSSTGALEGAHAIFKDELVSISEQQFVDCAKGIHYLNFGCNGGMQSRAFNWAIDQSNNATGIVLESEYPYTARDGDCQIDSMTGSVLVDSHTAVNANDKEAMKHALMQQPLAVSIEADKAVFQTYTGGILSSAECGTTLDHAVLAVGWGEEDGQEYFLIKNSWSSSWGVDGYIKLAADEGNGTCGVQMGPLYPTLK